jgi:hypothetical protein
VFDNVRNQQIKLVTNFPYSLIGIEILEFELEISVKLCTYYYHPKIIPVLKFLYFKVRSRVTTITLCNLLLRAQVSFWIILATE